MRLVLLTLLLMGFWLVMSGHYTALLISMGVFSCILATVVAVRMGIADSEGNPFHLLPRAMLYWPWLIVEIIKSAINVIKIILNPKLPISPTMVTVRSSQKTDTGRVTYANSITLTPGTLSVDVLENGDILVHALTAEGAEDVKAGVMDAKVSSFEGGA